jgi:hypothetical protein
MHDLAINMDAWSARPSLLAPNGSADRTRLETDLQEARVLATQRRPF